MSDRRWFDSNLFQISYIKVLIKSFNYTNARKTFNFIKFIYPKYMGMLTVYFLRKNPTFIKSKYSKNRQWSKSIVYFGLWFGVISAYILLYYCYRFTVTFSYTWWMVAIFLIIVPTINFRKNINHFNFNFIRFFF